MPIARHLTLTLLATLLAAGCTKFVEDASDRGGPTDVPAETGDLPGEAGDADPDGAELPDADVPDGTDTGDAGDLPDTPPGDVLAGGAGWPCLGDGECIEGRCAAWSGARPDAPGVCTGPCDAGCPVGLQCLPLTGPADTACEPMARGLCAPCRAASDCPADGGQCVEGTGGRYCTAPCGSGLACPDGFTCSAVDVPDLPEEWRFQCLSDLGGCACAAETDGAAFPCQVSGDAGTCKGARTCEAATGWGACDARVPGTEACNGADDDCNGRTDEGFVVADGDGALRGLGQSCGIGRCAGGTVECAPNGTVRCSTAANRQDAETCASLGGDGVDDDCDGETDETCGSPDRDGDGTANETDCFPDDAGRYPGAFETCCPTSTPAQEVGPRCEWNCDGRVTYCAVGDLDGDGYAPPNDCDDSRADVHPGAAEKCNDGIDQDCQQGDVTCCVPGQVGCTGALDEDMDGYIRPYDCDDLIAEIHPGAQELCNGRDDDCDGLVDEGNPQGAIDPENPGAGFALAGAPCGQSEGECQEGRWACVHYPPFGQRMECLGARGTVAERCNGKDDDCDGSTDEDYTLPAGACDGSDADECARGTWACEPGGQGVFCREPLDQTDVPEACDNGLDDDCDGETDEGCLPDDVDGDGVLPPEDCDDNRSEVRPGAGEACCDPALKGEAALAACDWNCDGTITPCAADDLDRDGYKAATSGGNDCNDGDPRVRPGAPEKCGDKVDQDCNGADLACVGLTDLDGDGFAPPFDCADNQADVNPWAPERCNDKDDDCDGITDEGNPGSDGQPCGSATGQCRPGTSVCVHDAAGTRLDCVPVQGPVRELCNGLDDNCNGLTDEAFPGLGLPCDGPDGDSCARGIQRCKADLSDAECGPEDPADRVETCNGLDDDCDGEVDEGFDYGGLTVGAGCLGQGVCGPGLVECAVDGARATCSTNGDGSASQGRAELCDGVDNDCDGLTDDGVNYNGAPLGEPCTGVGTCGAGTVECASMTLQATCSSNPDGSAPAVQPETCNGQDDDCDGLTDDEVTAAPEDCRRLGPCAGIEIPATCAAGKWACDYSAVPGYQDVETLCDGLDNDCDGTADDDFGIGQPCDGPDNDQCRNGLWACRPDQTGADCGIESATNLTETCNGLDDDCDGLTDENYQVGERCDGPDGDSCATGTYTCTTDGSGVECVNESPNSGEACNGRDDDCDGLTDEDFPLGQGCDGPDEDRCANGVFTCLPDGLGVQCSGDVAGTPTKESCNGKDDDCDGGTDEDWSWQGNAVGRPCDGTGACGAGVVECKSATTATCSSNPDGTASQATDEACNLLDDNCDGFTDEGLEWQGIALGNFCDPPGICGPGVVECSATSNQPTCSTMPDGSLAQGTAESCNQFDDDCNGMTDDIAVPDLSGCRTEGICAGLTTAACLAGDWICDYSAVPGFLEGAETGCDGRDENCDGTTDEPWGGGQPCDGPDSDQCLNGRKVCTPDGLSTTCGVETPADVPETCGDGVDNDCDGQTDEEGAALCQAYFLNVDGDSRGVTGDSRCLCAAGQVAWYTALLDGDCDDSDPLVLPGAPERCNARDDDCDGGTDEDYPTLQQACDGDDPDACANGTWGCQDDGLACLADTNGPEACNGKDDDCNGQTDETFLLGVACDGGDADECLHGLSVCDALGTGVECGPEDPAGIPEACNGADDDCDGLSDEDFPQKGTGCVSGLGACQRAGVYVCSTDGLGVNCNAVPGTPGTETCNGTDENCDGVVDDPWPLKGTKCSENAQTSCQTGIYTCNATKNGLQCTGETECAVNTTCQDSGSPNVPNLCMCGTPPTQSVCTLDIATGCVSGQCRCGGLAACTGGKKCVFSGSWVCQ